MKVLPDTCVIMDFLQNREPFAQDAKKIIRSKVDCIVTRNEKDYVNSIVTVYTPKEFVEILEKDK